MAKEGEYKISDIYQGGYSSLDPSHGDFFTGYRANLGNLSISTNPQNAAVAKEVSDKLNLGVKNIEVETILPKIFDAMPKQDFKEINRLSKLTGVEVSFHGPLVEPSGMTQQGFSESNRESAERQIQEAMERVREANPKNATMNFHTSNMFPAPDMAKTKEGEKISSILVVDNSSNSIGKIPLKERYFPGDEGISVEKELSKVNEEYWKNALKNLSWNADKAEEAIENYTLNYIGAEAEEKAGKKIPELERGRTIFTMGTSYLNEAYREMKGLFELMHKCGTENDKKILGQYRKEVEKDALEIMENEKKGKKDRNIPLMQKIIERGIKTFSEVSTPEVYEPLDSFMIDKTSTTFGNAAFNSFEKFGQEAPIIVIENPPANQQFARGEDVKNIVEKSREQFVKKAVEEKKMPKSEAQKLAEKFIGATWDVGHINMLRQFGFTEKDIIKETEKVAPFVKNVHLSDNFGFEHTELPMGMGNVPLKEIMKKLGEKGFEAKKVIEAGDWWTQHRGEGTPLKPSLEGMGSPIYSMKMAPYWNQTVGFQQDYFSGYGQIFPQGHYESFGAGFSQLPMELGGQRPGAQGNRMSGRPME